MKFFRCLILQVVGLTMVFTLGVVSAAASPPEPSGWTVPKIVRGLVGVLSVKWWNWVSVYPLSETPLNQDGDVDCSFGQKPGPIWFLAGTLSGETVRNCAIPDDKALFFPLLNVLVWPPDCVTIAECRELAATFMEPISDLFCTVDGAPCTLHGLQVQAQSPPYILWIPEGSLFTEFGSDPGAYFPAISDGVWALLPPLSAGDHVIHFGGAVGDPPFEVDVTYNISVE